MSGYLSGPETACKLPSANVGLGCPTIKIWEPCNLTAFAAPTAFERA